MVRNDRRIERRNRRRFSERAVWLWLCRLCCLASRIYLAINIHDSRSKSTSLRRFLLLYNLCSSLKVPSRHSPIPIGIQLNRIEHKRVRTTDASIIAQSATLLSTRLVNCFQPTRHRCKYCMQAIAWLKVRIWLEHHSGHFALFAPKHFSRLTVCLVSCGTINKFDKCVCYRRRNSLL